MTDSLYGDLLNDTQAHPARRIGTACARAGLSLEQTLSFWNTHKAQGHTVDEMLAEIRALAPEKFQ